MTLKILVCKCKTFLIQKCWTLVQILIQKCWTLVQILIQKCWTLVQILIQKCWTLLQTDATVNTSGQCELIIDHFSTFIDNFSTFMQPVLTEATIDEKMLNTGTNWCHPYPIEVCKLFTKIGIHTSKSAQTTKKRQENLEWKGVLGSLTHWSMTLKLKAVVMRCPV